MAVQAFATGLLRPELDEDLLAYKPNLNLRGPEQLVVRFGPSRQQRGARTST